MSFPIEWMKMDRYSAQILRLAQRATVLLGLLTGLSVLIGPDAGAQKESINLITVQFDVERAELQKEHEDQIHILQEKYQSALHHLGKQFSAQGNLDGVLAVKKEITRFAGSSRVDADGLRSGIPRLANLQNTYVTQQGKIDAVFKQQLGNILRSYLSKLEQLEVRLTQGGKIEEAIAVKKQRQDIARKLFSKSSVQSEKVPLLGKPSTTEKQAVEAAVILPAAAAKLIGNTRISNDAVNYWTGDESFAEWNLPAIKPGNYALHLTYANDYSTMSMIVQVVRNTSSSRIKKNRSRVDANARNVVRHTIIDTGTNMTYTSEEVGTFYLSPLTKIQMFKDPDDNSFSSPFIKEVKLVRVDADK